MNQTILSAAIILLIACALLVAGSYARFTEGYINYMTSVPDGFCGVDLPPCPHPLRCVNAYCQSVDAPEIPRTSGLPVLPEGYIRL